MAAQDFTLDPPPSAQKKRQAAPGAGFTLDPPPSVQRRAVPPAPAPAAIQPTLEPAYPLPRAKPEPVSSLPPTAAVPIASGTTATIEPTPAMAAARAITAGVQDYLVNPMRRGKQSFDQGIVLAEWYAKRKTDEEAAREIAQQVRERDAIRPSAAYEKAAEEYERLPTTGLESALATGKHLLTNPQFAVPLAVESFTSGLAPPLGGAVLGGLGGGMVAGPAGAGLGTVAGAAGGGALTDYSAEFLGYLAEKGVDLRDENAVLAAFRNKELVAEAESYAAKHAAVVGLFSAVGAGVGGKIAGKAALPGLGLGQRAGLGAAAVGVDVASEMAGEAGGQLWGKGEVDVRDVVTEGLLSPASSVVDVAMRPVAEAFAAWRQENEPPPAPLLGLPQPSPENRPEPEPPSSYVEGPHPKRTPGLTAVPQGGPAPVIEMPGPVAAPAPQPVAPPAPTPAVPVAAPTSEPPPVAPTPAKPASRTAAKVTHLVSTAKGSTYQLYADGTTKRTKSSGQPLAQGETATKPRSNKTFYLDEKLLYQLIVPDAAPDGDLTTAKGSWRVVENGDGTLGVLKQGTSGTWKPVSLQESIPVTTAPAPGMRPVELWGQGTQIKGLPAYRKMHIGSPIVEIKVAKAPPARRKPPPPPPVAPTSPPPPPAAPAPVATATPPTLSSGGPDPVATPLSLWESAVSNDQPWEMVPGTPIATDPSIHGTEVVGWNAERMPLFFLRAESVFVGVSGAELRTPADWFDFMNKETAFSAAEIRLLGLKEVIRDTSTKVNQMTFIRRLVSAYRRQGARMDTVSVRSTSYQTDLRVTWTDEELVGDVLLSQETPENTLKAIPEIVLGLLKGAAAQWRGKVRLSRDFSSTVEGQAATKVLEEYSRSLGGKLTSEADGSLTYRLPMKFFLSIELHYNSDYDQRALAIPVPGTDKRPWLRIAQNAVVDPGVQRTYFGALKELSEMFTAMSKAIGLPPPLWMFKRIEAREGLYYNRGNTVKIGVESVGYAQVLNVAAHEWGHAVHNYLLMKAPRKTKNALYAAFEREMQGLADGGFTAKEIIERVRSVGKKKERQTLAGQPGYVPTRDYELKFSEWFAEQTARWMLSDAKPRTLVDKFFKKVGDILNGAKEIFLTEVPGRRLEQLTAVDAVAEFYDGLFGASIPLEAVSAVRAQMLVESIDANQLALNRTGAGHVEAVSSDIPGDMIEGALGVAVGATAARAAGAHVARFNWVYKYFLSLPQVALRNPHIAALQRYKQYVQNTELTKAQIGTMAVDNIRGWRKLGQTQATNIARYLRALDQLEHSGGKPRWPTPQEDAALRQKYGVTKAPAVAQAREIQKSFAEALNAVERVLAKKANRLNDPQAKAARLAGIAKEMAALRKAPYFPNLRFGRYALRVVDPANNNRVIYREHFPTKKEAWAAQREAEESGVAAPGSGYVTNVIEVPDAAIPLVGMPPGLLDGIIEVMRDKGGITPAQEAAIQEMRLFATPDASFRHRFRKRQRIGGFSQDFIRTYGNYFIHAANYISKLEYIDDMKDEIAQIETAAANVIGQGGDGIELGGIGNFLRDHNKEFLNPTSDWYQLRSMAFIWALGFNVASATVNLSQLLTASYPFLASKFGDVATIREHAKAAADVRNTYVGRKKLPAKQGAWYRALSELIERGIVTEAQVPELAGYSTASFLERTGRWNEWLEGFMRASAIPFQAAEQMNRRVTARAAWQLAQQQPQNRYVQEAITRNQLLYDDLINTSRMAPLDAAATVVAADAVYQAHFQYSQAFQPRFMRGKLRTVFMFKNYMQNMLVMYANNPTAAARSLLVIAGISGLLGLPGAEDLDDLLKFIGFKFHGKDWSMERAIKEFVTSLTDNDWAPGLITGGAGKYGFGIPTALDGLGGFFNTDIPYPYLDRSAAMSMGNVLPVPLSTFLGPQGVVAPGDAFRKTAQESAGAAFGVWFNVADFLQSVWVGGETDWRKAQKAMPRFLGNLAKAWDYSTRGFEIGGAKLEEFDVWNDPEHATEVIAQALGYTPYRTSRQWDEFMDTKEKEMLWKVKRQARIDAMAEARRYESDEHIAEAQEQIREFNDGLPDHLKGMAITSDTLRRSWQTKERNRRLREEGLATQKMFQGLVDESRRLNPKPQIRPVK